MLDIECFSFLNRALEAPLRIPLETPFCAAAAGRIPWDDAKLVFLTSSLHDLSFSAQSHICDVGW
jgi:hypothetical protein